MDDIYDLLNNIKRIALGATEASEPVEVDFGVVVDTDPLTVDLGDFTIEDDLLIMTRTVKSLVDSEGLEEGDYVLLIKDAGGDAWIAIDAVEVDDDD